MLHCPSARLDPPLHSLYQLYLASEVAVQQEHSDRADLCYGRAG